MKIKNEEKNGESIETTCFLIASASFRLAALPKLSSATSIRFNFVALFIAYNVYK